MTYQRDKLIAQVKAAYAEMASQTSRDNFIDQSSAGESMEHYYERRLQEAISAIQSGQYDHMGPDFHIVDHLANHAADYLTNQINHRLY